MRSHIDDYDGTNICFENVQNELKTCYGAEKLRAYNSSRNLVPTDSLEDVILNGWPGQVLDIVEVWLMQHPDSARECEHELNQRLLGHGCPWRFISGEAVLIDSEFLNSEIRVKCIELLGNHDIPGALEEYKDAINDLTANENKDAIIKAHKSVESVMKSVLNKHDGTFGALLQALIKSDIIPEYYDEFLSHFERLALGAVKERNLPARGHGQGKEPTEVSHALAEFVVHLAGAINQFIVQRWVERKQAIEDII